VQTGSYKQWRFAGYCCFILQG